MSTVTTELHASDAGAPNVKVEDVRALLSGGAPAAAVPDELGASAGTLQGDASAGTAACGGTLAATGLPAICNSVRLRYLATLWLFSTVGI